MNLLIKSTWASPTDPNESQTTVILTAITDEGETLDPDFQKFRTLDDPDTISEHTFGQWGGYANPWLAMIYLRRLLPAMMPVHLATTDFPGIAG